MRAMTLPDLDRYDTLPKLLAHNAENFPTEIAMREKDFGIWNEYSWADYQEHVRSIGLGLRELGVAKGDVVVIIGDNRPAWVWCELAVHAAGGMSLGIYRDALEDEVAYLVNYAEAKVVVAEDEEQVDKFLDLGDRVGSVRTIVYIDPRGMRKFDDPRLISLEDMQQRGRAVLEKDAAAYDTMIDEVGPDDVAVLCTTSGTTSNPKLAMLQHGAILRHCARYLETDPKGPDDDYVSTLPLPWIMEQVYSIAWVLLSRMKVNFVEEQDTTMHDMREIGPTFALFAPRLWEQIAADVRARMMDAVPWKQKLYEFGVKLGLEALEKGRKSWLADLLVLGPLRDRLGFSKVRSAVTGGAALGPDTFKFFMAMGVPLRQLYGQTELLGAYTLHEAGDVDFDSVGKPFKGVETRIDKPDPEGVGEIWTRHPNMMLGFYKNEEETRATVDSDGWLHTGDAGYFNENGHLIVIDRTKDLATTSKGNRFSPQFIENKLKFSPYVAEAVILGANRDYLAAIICIRYSILSKWAEKNRIAFTTYSDLAARPEVYELIRDEVEQVNQSLPAAQRIRKFLLLYKELDADDGELTRTRKVRRGVISEKYADIIDTLYSDRDAVDIDTVIQFQDGSTQRIVTSLKVVSFGDAAARPPADTEPIRAVG